MKVLHNTYRPAGRLDRYLVPGRRTCIFPSGLRKEFVMTVARVTEIKSSSSVSFDDAIREGIARAEKTLKNVKSAWIENQEVLIGSDGQISEYRVQMRITFVLLD